MAARSVGIVNAASQAGKAPQRRGRAPSGREAVVVLAEEAVVNSAVGVAVVAVVMSAAGVGAAAVWAVMGAAGGDEPGEGS
jgi:hypothetical protein